MLERLEADGPTDLRESFTEFASRGRAAGPRRGHFGFSRSERLRGGPQDSARRSATTCSSCTSRRSAIAIRAPFGDVRFVDAETGEVRDIDVTPRARRGLPPRPGRRTPRSSSSFCGRYNLGYVRADAERPFEDIILQTFRQGRFLA